MYCTTQYCIPVMWCTLVLYASSYIKCFASCFDVVCFVPAMLPIKVSHCKETLFLICHCFVCSAGVMLCNHMIGFLWFQVSFLVWYWYVKFTFYTFWYTLCSVLCPESADMLPCTNNLTVIIRKEKTYRNMRLTKRDIRLNLVKIKVSIDRDSLFGWKYYGQRESLWLKILLTDTASLAKNTIDRDPIFRSC